MLVVRNISSQIRKLMARYEESEVCEASDLAKLRTYRLHLSYVYHLTNKPLASSVTHDYAIELKITSNQCSTLIYMFFSCRFQSSAFTLLALRCRCRFSRAFNQFGPEGLTGLSASNL